MAHINAGKTKPEYDVIVVGSGAAGGQTAYTLAMEGVKVLMLEAGRDYDPITREQWVRESGVIWEHEGDVVPCPCVAVELRPQP